MIESAIDIGTNTMLMLTAEVEETGGPTRKILRTLDDRINFVRLGQGVHQNRAFAPEAMERALKCFHEYRKVADSHKAQKVRAVATSASRDSKNAREFYGRVKSETGIEVQVIEGETEARLSFLGGLLPYLDPAKSAILDIGGGSTEFVALNPDGKGVHGQSMDMGCVRATEMFLTGDPYEKPALDAMEKHLRGVWAGLDANLQKELRAKEWVGIAGTPTTLAALTLKLPAFNTDKVDGYRMDRCMIGDYYESLATMRQAERAANPIMGTGRADIMVAGVAILLTAMEYFAKDEVIVSSRGLRHGVMLSPP